jgi:ABC-type uncharacterized transport system permease subunit
MDPILFLANLIGATFRVSTPILLAAIGETYAERAGILNLGIEGTMLFGAYIGFSVADMSGSLWLGLAVAILFGVFSGLLMGLLTVKLGVNQHVSGLSVTLLLTGLSLFLFRLNYGGRGGEAPPSIVSFPFVSPFKDVPVLGVITEQYLLTYVAFLLIVPLAWWVLYRTNYGLKLRAVGENPEAADAAGINVYAMRYSALAIGGGLMAAGGAFLSVHSRHHLRQRLGGDCHCHLWQLESGEGDGRSAHLWRDVCPAITFASHGLAVTHSV